MQKYGWAVVGAGPAGIATIGKLLDNGVDPKTIAWIDPEFRVGDLGAKWNHVSSNTRVNGFVGFLSDCKSFDYDAAKTPFALHGLDPNETCLIREVVEPLQWVTDRLREKVASIESTVLGLGREGEQWHVRLDHGDMIAKNVVLAMGAEPKKLGYPKQVISLECALDKNKLEQAVDKDDVVAVFGSSHSAIMAIRNLTDLRAGRVINFYRTPLRYAIYHADWILYDNTGLKGETARWAKENMNGKLPDGLLRFEATRKNIELYLPRCSKVIYGVGFEPRLIKIDGVGPTQYNDKTGVVGPGLFGCGIAFPEKVVDRAGNTEYGVGLWKFIRYLDRVVPLWIKGDGAAKA